MALTGSEPDLQLGDSGEGVMLLQVRLYGLAIFLDFPDGTFGLSTENAVRQLQSQLGQDNDGIVTTATWQALQHQETQYGIQYQYVSPYDALAQLRYDLENPRTASGTFGVLTGEPGQYTPAGLGGQFDPVARYDEYSEDGQWRWDGYDWQPVDVAPAAATEQAATANQTLSEDGQWRWDGYDWQPVDAGAAASAGTATTGVTDWTGTLSEDGQWRWNGLEWQPV